ncbi:hypothetical protein GALMADRAFT_138969 [Galerina marginata CBS 339.88]|uniref:MYND-type domain-containing protein n=1 Tax=Galerina marginata (strain CBS 339.88) TaxID=685588 RepID=A0A067T3R5_GALM3|nr:hypothetical protein GALMADRAFT_138969 [Galerina marginata CBS 339.88]
MSSRLVKKFNALPRNEKAPSGLVPNEWHFDLRYIQIEPTPGHIVAIIQPQSQFIHMERLPVGIGGRTSGITFFPESGKEAAPEVAKALLHAFVDNLGQNQMMGSNAPPVFAPWKLTTEDKDLAAAVGEEFKRLGVRAKELHKISVSSKSVNKIMDTAFRKLFATLKQAVGFTGIAGDVIMKPDSICFHNFKLTPAPKKPSLLDHEEGPFDLALNYLQQLMNSRPPNASDIDTKTLLTAQGQELPILMKKVEDKPAAIVKAEADGGDPDAALDYGLRLLVGLGCDANRTSARTYLIKALSSPKATDELKAIAHGILIDWYVSSCVNDFRSRYMFAASHHANIAAALCRRVSPPGTHASPAVLWFMSKVFEPQSKKAPELYLWFKDAVKALEFRNAQMADGRKKMEQKRLKNPNRYCCAAVGCGIEADSGRMLLRCGGKCDADKKPSYCSKECQLADWQNHKPFCKPGAECSVIDTGNSPRLGAGPSSKQGAIQIPITHADGSTHVVSSSTLDPQMLKEIRDLAQNADVSGRGLPSMTFDLERVTI